MKKKKGRRSAKKKYPIPLLNATQLKLIAMVSMVFDHVGDAFFPEQDWMRAIGRIAMPIFSFCIAEGYEKSRDRKSYMTRLGLFALLSEVPFDLFSSGKILEFSHQNVILTFYWALLGLMCYEALKVKKTKAADVGSIFILIFFALTSLFSGMDYNILAIGIIDIFYLLRKKDHLVSCLTAMAFYVFLRNKGIYWFGVLGFIVILLYDGKRGKGLKRLFYLFYPGHLLLIGILKQVLH